MFIKKDKTDRKNYRGGVRVRLTRETENAQGVFTAGHEFIVMHQGINGIELKDDDGNLVRLPYNTLLLELVDTGVDVNELRQLLAAAPGDTWEITRNAISTESKFHGTLPTGSGDVVCMSPGEGDFHESAKHWKKNAELMVAMRNKMPSLLDEVERMREALEEIAADAKFVGGNSNEYFLKLANKGLGLS